MIIVKTQIYRRGIVEPIEIEIDKPFAEFEKAWLGAKGRWRAKDRKITFVFYDRKVTWDAQDIVGVEQRDQNG